MWHLPNFDCIFGFTEKIVIRLNKKDSRVTLTFEGMLCSKSDRIVTFCRYTKYVTHVSVCILYGSYNMCHKLSEINLISFAGAEAPWCQIELIQ